MIYVILAFLSHVFHKMKLVKYWHTCAISDSRMYVKYTLQNDNESLFSSLLLQYYCTRFRVNSIMIPSLRCLNKRVVSHACTKLTNEIYGYEFFIQRQ